MQVGSHVVCAEKLPAHLYYQAMLLGLTVPEVGKEFIVELISRCSCGQHDNLLLNDRDGFWDARYFREVEPPLNIEQLMEEVEQQEFATV